MSLDGNTQGKIVKRALILAIGVIIIFLIFLKEDSIPYIYGIIFGVCINILNFRLMSLTLERAVKMPQHKVMPYIVGNYMIRYIIYGIVLIISAIADYINFYTAVLGIFMVKIVILADTLYGILKKIFIGKQKISDK